MPSVLAELGFITNPQDADKLKSDNGQEHAADAVVNGIETYYSGNYKICVNSALLMCITIIIEKTDDKHLR